MGIKERLAPEEEPEMRGAIFDMFKKESGKDPEVQTFEIGDTVICDWCGKDYTDPPESEVCGGLMFGSKACCPECVPRVIEGAKTYNEEKYITEHCPAGLTFKKWVIGLRGGNNTVKVFSFNPEKEPPEKKGVHPDIITPDDLKVKCRWCGKEIKGFRDDVSKKEFKITGMCQKCQDDIF